MAFKLRSGNKSPFKNIGSSPAKLAGLAAKVAPMIAGKVMSKLNEEESPAKQKKTYPKSYTKKDIAFLKEQKEDVVRREDLDEEGKKIYDANQAKAKKNKKKNKKKTKTREDYLNEGFSQVEADQMVKEGGVTGYDTQKEINKGRGRKVKKTPAKQKSTTSAHGQLNDAESDYITDTQRKARHKDFKKRAAEANKKAIEAKKARNKAAQGEGFMHPPYKKPVGPTEKRKAYHGYKNFKSNLDRDFEQEKREDAKGVDTNIKTRKVMKDGSKNRVHYHKKTKK